MRVAEDFFLAGLRRQRGVWTNWGEMDELIFCQQLSMLLSTSMHGSTQCA